MLIDEIDIQELDSEQNALRGIALGKIAEEAFNQALSEYRAVSIPHEPLKDSLTCLGDKIDAQYSPLKGSDETARIARKWLWIATRTNQLGWLKRIAGGLTEDTEQNRRYAETFEAGYDDDLGWAFSDFLGSLKYSEVIESDHPGLRCYDLLEAISRVWFCEADSLACAGDAIGAMAKIADAFSAVVMAHGVFMWEEGNKCAKEDAPSPASALAKRRHAENYGMKDDALKHWRANIDPSLSAQKAADQLLNVVPLSHKKLAEIVSAEKKKKS